MLSVNAPFTASPLLVSGTDAYRDGEYIYQDYLFDDRGADTAPGPGTRFENGRNASAPTAGDVMYPTADRYGGNAADLVEFRIKQLPDSIVYRVTLNTARAADAAVVGIGIDTDRSGGAPVGWPYGAGISSPGLDRFITAWGTGGAVTSFPGVVSTPLPAGAVSMDVATNQMTIRVPRSIMNPGTATWRYVAGAGLWSGAAWKPVPAGVQPSADQAASGNPVVAAPAVYNLAFRFNEPQMPGTAPPYTTFPGIGNWFEDRQANLLSQRTSGDFHADVDFGKLAARSSAWVHRPGRLQARIFASRFEPYEGVRAGFPGYGTELQPYILVVPPSYSPTRPARLTLALHSGDATYTQYAVNGPHLYNELGDQRRSLVLTPFARGPDTQYTGVGEADVFEAWADVARHFALDSESVALTGYSFGGYGAYRLGVHYPDLFGRAFTGVGLPGIQGWAPPAPPEPGGEISNVHQLVENVRWVPYLNWAQVTDEINPYTGVRALADRFDALGLRNQLWTFTSGDHFLLAIEDEWGPVRDFLGAASVQRDPSRVDYAFFPQADTPRFGLRFDHAYWVSHLRPRKTTGDPQTAPARGFISAKSLAFGEGDPAATRIQRSGAGEGPPTPATIDGVQWGTTPRRAATNALQVRLSNVRAATIDGCRARLSSASPIRVGITSDGGATVTLALPLASGTTVRAEGAGATGEARSNGASLTLARAGSATFVIRSSRAVACAGAASSMLSLTVRPRTVRACRATLFRFGVRHGRSPVAGATVRFAGRRATTDASGRAHMRVALRDTGRHRARASKRGTAPASATVTVRRAGRCGTAAPDR